VGTRGGGEASRRRPLDERELERLTHEYDEQIAAMDENLARKRRAAFLPGDASDDDERPEEKDDEPPPRKGRR
jgi:hypothetical protein